MDDGKGLQVRCAWDGDPSTWVDYIRRVRLTYEKTRHRKRKYLGPELAAQLTGRAWVVTQEIDHRRLVANDGARFLVEFLEERLGRVPVPDAGTKAEELFVKMRRPVGMTMASWCHKVRETYRGLQRALKRARKEQGDDITSAPPESPMSGGSRRRDAAPSGPTSPSSSRRRSSKRTVEEPEGDATPQPAVTPTSQRPSPTSPMPDGGDAPLGKTDSEVEAELERKGKGRGSQRRRRVEDSDTETEDILEGLKVWDDLDSHLPDVLPPELLGWLMLRRCSLSPQQRLNILSTVGNSLKAEDIERGLRGAEEELRLTEREPHGKGGGKKGRPVFWMEQGGEWALLNAMEEDMEDWLQDAHWVGSTSDLASNYGVLGSTSTSTLPSSSGGGDGDGTWFQDLDGSYSWWDLDAESGEYYHQDAAGAFWAWSDWETMQFQSYFSEDQQRELADAYAAYEGKLRSFADSRNLVYQRQSNRGFYPNKGKGKNKTKGKPRPTQKGGKTGSAMAADALAVGTPGYTGCFICGSKDHEFRSCPKRSQSGTKSKGKGSGNVYVAQALGDQHSFNVYAGVPSSTARGASSMSSTSAAASGAAPVNIYTVHAEPDPQFDIPGVISEMVGHVSQPDVSGFAVIDTGATETITSLEALEFVINKRRQRFGVEHVQVIDRPQKVFRFGNGQTQTSESFVLIPQTMGTYQIFVGAFALDAPGVPLLLGIRSLSKLGAILDCSRSVMVLKSVDATLMIPLKKSHTGHLLIDLCDNWLEGGSRIFYGDNLNVSEKKIASAASSSFMVNEIEGDIGITHEGSQGFSEHGGHDTHVAAAQPLEPSETVSAISSSFLSLMSENEKKDFEKVELEDQSEWLADLFAVRSERLGNPSELQPSSSSSAAAADNQDMSLRTLAWLASAPLLLASTNLGHVVQWNQGEGEDHCHEEWGQGQGREIRLVPANGAGSTRSKEYWPAVHGQSRPSSPRQRLSVRVERPWVLDGLQPLQNAPHVRARVRGACPDTQSRYIAGGCREAGSGTGQRGSLRLQAAGQGHRPGCCGTKLHGEAGEDQASEGRVPQGEETRDGARADCPTAKGENSADCNGGELGGGRQCNAARPKGTKNGNSRGVGSSTAGGDGDTKVLHRGGSLNEEIFVTKYELMPENETHDEDATDYDQASEETYVTKNLADFESKRIHLSLEEYFEEFDDNVFECGRLRECDMLDVLELCCEEDSLLTATVLKMGGKAERAGLFNGCDLLKESGREKVKEIIRTRKPRWIWVSYPCGPTSPIQHLNEITDDGWRKSMKRRQRHRRLLKAGNDILEDYANAGGNVAWEWPRYNEGWKLSEVRTFWNKFDYMDHDFDGCMFNLKSVNGYHKKPWRLRCNRKGVFHAMERCCDGSHRHDPSMGGTVARKTGLYTPQMCSLAAKIMLGYYMTDYAIFGAESIVIDREALKTMTT